jgi:hypothetical protein
MSQMSRLQCRQQMHAAERLARQPNLRGPIDWLLAPIETAYMSPECEPQVAQRISAALNRIGY